MPNYKCKTLNQYLSKIKPYMIDLLIQHQQWDNLSKVESLSNKQGDQFDRLINELIPNKKPAISQQSGCISIKTNNNYEHLLNIAEWLKPWRKGPFKLNNLIIDSEWQSQLKWNRIKEIIKFKNKRVLDIGTGNGFYLYNIAHKQASQVVGLEPHPLYIMQFLFLNALAPQKEINFIPQGWQCCNVFKPVFDIILCMGVLYHQKFPITLLSTIKNNLKHQGSLYLETIIIERSHGPLLTPQGRYCAMKNVYYIPTLDTLYSWIKNAGFNYIEVVDITKTTSLEQRSTQWSSQQSLENFLHPNKKNRTIEGYPAPIRAILKIN